MNQRLLLKLLLISCTVVTLLVTGLLDPGFVGRAAAQPLAVQSPDRPTTALAASPDGDPLLLVHGFQDTCQYAFQKTDMVPNTGLNALTTLQYLGQNGWAASALETIGYYDPINQPFTEYLWNGTSATTYDNTCTYNLQNLSSSDQAASDSCSSLLNGNVAGTPDDPLEHLGCLFAWYVYDTYGEQPVDILAHSMGGLIVRDAIGESGRNPRFPPSPLNVHVVVTVGTPHGGVYGAYLYLAEQLDGTPQELLDMVPGSAFMNLLSQSYMEDPQGLFGTYWDLMASSVGCTLVKLDNPQHFLGTGDVSCAAQAVNLNGPYPDGDGVVQADSALAMPADFKILYGNGLWCRNNDCSNIGYNFISGGLQYSHEANTCTNFSIPIIVNGVDLFDVGPFCLNQPFYLNDGTNGTTWGWVCNAGCTSGSPGLNNGGLNDVQALSNAPVAVPDSLQEIAFLLAGHGPGTSGGPRITVGHNSSGPLELFVKGSNGAIWHRWQTGSSGSGWSGWASLGSVSGVQWVGKPIVGQNSNGRLELFVRGSDGAIWHMTQNGSTGTGWTGWSSLGGDITSDPAVGRNSDGRLELFARWSDGSLWHAWQLSPNETNGWSNWTGLVGGGGEIDPSSNPVVGQNSDGGLQVFARSGTGMLTMKQTGTTWGAIIFLQGQLTGDPTVGQNSDGRLEAFAQGTDQTLQHAWQFSPNGTNGWSGWASLGNQLLGDPTVGTNSNGNLELFIRGTDGALWHSWQTGPGGTGWSGWLSLGGSWANDPAVGQNTNGALELFLIGTTGTLQHAWQTASSGSGWSGWVSLGAMP